MCFRFSDKGGRVEYMSDFMCGCVWVYKLWYARVCVRVPLPTQQSSEAGQVLCLQPELPGSLRQQILVCGQVLAVPAQFECVRGEVGGYVTEGKLRILSDQASKSIVPVERQHFLVVVLQSLYNLWMQNGQIQHEILIKLWVFKT